MIWKDIQQCSSEKPGAERDSFVKLFRILVATSTITFVLAAFSPRLNWGAVWPETSDLLRHDGSMAIMPLPTFVVALLMLLWVSVAVGLWQFNRHARLSFLLLTAMSVVLTALGGISVQLPFEVVLEYAVALMDGAIVAMAYFSPVAEKFALKGGNASTIRSPAQTV